MNQMFMTSNYLDTHYLTSMWLGAAHISKFIIHAYTCIVIKVCESKKTVCESNVYDLKLLVDTLSHEFI